MTYPQSRSRVTSSDFAVPIRVRRRLDTVRVPWSVPEDESITAHFMQANGGFLSYRKQAECLNDMFHAGKPVRTGSAVRRREIALLKPNTNLSNAPKNGGKQL